MHKLLRHYLDVREKRPRNEFEKKYRQRIRMKPKKSFRKMKGKNGILLFVEFLKGLLEDKKDEELQNHKEEMGVENERERTSSMKDCEHNILHKPILLKMEKEIINL